MSTEIDLPDKVLAIAKKLAKLEPSKKHFFFEAGANDGLTQNNTIKLEPLGWQGILVEPSPKAFEKLAKNRSDPWLFNCAIGEHKGTFVSGDFEEGGLTGSCESNTKKKSLLKQIKDVYSLGRYFFKFRSLPKQRQLIEVPVNTISNLLNQCDLKRIDIMIIDLEGYELAALKGMNFGPMPRILIVETRKANAFDINNLLLSFGFALRRSISNFDETKDPGWDGSHQDYLWVLSDDSIAIEASNICK